MSELVEYFVRHYTLVLDNDQGTYLAVRQAVRGALRESGMTPSQYRALPDKERVIQFVAKIGEAVLELIEEWVDESVPQAGDSVGGMLVREILLLSGGDLAWALGEYYMPEDADVDEFLIDDDDEEA